MTGPQYAMLAYLISFALLGGYVLLMWRESCLMARREERFSER